MAEAMSAERLDADGMLSGSYRKSRVRAWLDGETGTLYATDLEFLLIENDQLRAQLAEIGQTRQEFGVRTYDDDEDAEVMSSREHARDLAEAWRREIPGRNPRVMVRTRQSKPGQWREVPDA